MRRWYKCDFGDGIANSEEDLPCENQATWKVVNKDGAEFYLCDEHLKTLKGIKNWIKINLEVV
jgi:hypothetical protein